MNNLKESFEAVADWCEKHLEEKRGREVGMTFGALLRAYGRLATLPARLTGKERVAKERQLETQADEFLRRFSARFHMVYDFDRPKVVDAKSVITNMTYDTGPWP